jgi:ketosteroid isomerase-like protein
MILRAQQHAPKSGAAVGHAEHDSLLVQRERASWEALKARDTTAFARLMGGDVIDVDVSGVKRTSPASVARYVLGCQTTGYAMSDVQIRHTNAVAVVTYKAAVDAMCWGQKAPSPLFVMTVYEQRGDAWAAIAHSETPATRW